MTTPTTDDIKKLHSAYCCLTGLQVPFTTQLMFMWEHWLFAGFTEPDLACVVRHLKQKIKEGKRPKESLLPRNLIQRTDFFGEDLAISRAENRNKPLSDARSSVLKSAGMSETVKDTAVPINQILERAKLAEMLGKWKAENL